MLGAFSVCFLGKHCRKKLNLIHVRLVNFLFLFSILTTPVGFYIIPVSSQEFSVYFFLTFQVCCVDPLEIVSSDLSHNTWTAGSTDNKGFGVI